VIATWLRRLSNAATLNMTAEQLVARMREMREVLGGYPAYCWTLASYVAAAKTFAFFPSVAEVEKFHQQRIERQRAAVYVTAALSSEKTRLEQLERERDREEWERDRAEWERKRVEAAAEAEREREMDEVAYSVDDRKVDLEGDIEF
jgi:hypothetical protein